MSEDRLTAVRERIQALLRDSLLVHPESADVDLVDTGAVDSADFMELFLLLEREFRIEIAAADLVLDNFRTIASMAIFVLAKQGAPEPPPARGSDGP